MQRSDAPFPHLIISDFLSKDEVKRIRKAVEALPFKRKDADLFSLEQSHDLTDVPELSELRAKLMGLAAELKTTFGVAVSRLDLSAMRYREGDYLLCHDDRLEGRKAAYILYLKKPRKGGQLRLLETTVPYNATSIEPEEGLLVIFAVSEKSWHEVAEVEKGERVSLGGWYH